MDRQTRRRPRNSYPIGNLTYVTDQGGRTRRHRVFGEVRAFLWPILAAAVLQSIVYVLITVRSGRNDWHNIATAICLLFLVPVVASAVLAAFRRHESTIIASVVVSVGLFSVAVSVLSALRIPVSYQGLSACLPIVVVLMAYANIRFNRSLASRVTLAPFLQAESVSKEIGGVPILSGPTASLENIEILLIDPLEHHSEQWSALLAKCYLGGIEIMPWTRYLEMKRGRLDVASFDISHLAYSPSQLIYARMKRPLDLLAVLVTLPLTLPMILLVAAYIAMRDRGPVIFVQLRRGYGGKTFRMYKFRTMYRGVSGGATGVRDIRILPGCEFIRKMRLDELPQLYNILRGDMSLIGPRPEAIDLAKRYERVISKYPMRLLVFPGITGWAQVNSGYSGNPEEALNKLSHDLYYIKRLSLDLDIIILFKTVRTVLFGSGAR